MTIMAQRGALKYLGSFRDVNHSPDRDGELFATLKDAALALEQRHRNTDWADHAVQRTVGLRFESYPMTTNDAAIFLWLLPEDRHYYPGVAADIFEERPLDTHKIMAGKATHVVWVGTRQAIRVGTPEEYEAQMRERKGRDVREAGSVVVTDA